MSRPNPLRALRVIPRSRPSSLTWTSTPTSRRASSSLAVSPRRSPSTQTHFISSRATLQSSLSSSQHQQRLLHSTPPSSHASKPPSGRAKPTRIDKTPPTDIADLDVLGSVPMPSTNIEATLPRGFLLNSGIGIFDGAGALLVGGEAFAWRPWLAKKKDGDGDVAGNGDLTLVNAKGQLELPKEAFATLSLLWPRPDLLVLGVGPTIRPLSPETRRHISELGIRVEVLDTRNASSQFNLLATERGVEDVGAALIPLGWEEGKGAVE